MDEQKRKRHRIRLAAISAVVALLAAGSGASARAAGEAQGFIEEPLRLLSMLQQDVETIYDLPAVGGPTPQQEQVNAGGVHIDLSVRYLTDYVFRGIDRSEPGGGFRDEDGNPVTFPADEGTSPGAEDAPNLQFDGRLTFDLGSLPHPFVGLFVNVYDDDPVSRFQEIRPVVGLEWTVRPLTVAAGHTNYIFPEREAINTAEVWVSAQLDDSVFFRTDKPVFTPYVLAAYDYDLYEGLYLEGGLKHDFELQDLGVTLTLVGRLAYVVNDPQFSAVPDADHGLQHYDIGLIGSYSLNKLLNVSSNRYGDFRLEGYLFYTDGIDNQLLADTQLWGGVGIGFHY
jgi:hypothetical protein